MTAKLLRKRASLLLVAKILVLSRLLHKTTSNYKSPPPFLEDLRNQLVLLRRTLMKRIDKRLASNSATDDTTIESLAAFCLVTNSSADDSIRHFHQVRLDVITNQLEASRENIPNALRLFLRTLQISKALRSRQFSDVLSKLKARPILSDPEIRDLDGLEIEVLGRWTAPEVNNFTPWIKLSEFSRAEGVDSIKQWSLQACERFCDGCQKCLVQSNDFLGLLALRANALELLLSSWGSTITHGPLDMLERLRTVFTDHLKRILTANVQTGDDIARQVEVILSSWETAEKAPVGSLWDSELITADLSNGAAAFKQAVTNRLVGRNEYVDRVLKRYQAWLLSIEEVKESINSLRNSKWTDVFVGAEVEDEEIEATPKLNKDDPDFLSDSFHSAIRETFGSLQTSFIAAFKAFGPSHRREKAIFLLRLIRLVRRGIPDGFVAEDFMFSDSVVPDLQKLIAEDIVTQTGSLSLLPSFNTLSTPKIISAVPGRSLWEGDPIVPVQPSPGTFKFLRRVTATMDDIGMDLWDPSTVHALKEELQTQLNQSLGSTLDNIETWKFDSGAVESPDKKTDGITESNEGREDVVGTNDQRTRADSEQFEGATGAEVLRDWKMQVLFDTVYLTNMLGGSFKLAGVMDRVQESNDLSPEIVKTIQKFARDYWKRTELLFGLLAQR